MRILDNDQFRGFFPHKGAHCARMIDWTGYVRWIKVNKGEKVVLSTPYSYSAGGIPVTSIEGGETLTNTYMGRSSRHVPTLMVNPGEEEYRLTSEWTFEVCQGADSWRQSLPKGSVLLKTRIGGDPTQAGRVWVLVKEVSA